MLNAPPLVEPAYANFPAYSETFGPEVADLCDLVGFAPDPEQELGLNALFGIDSDGKSTAFEFATIAARQNLKTGFWKQAALGWIYITEQGLIVWSAHEMSTTLEAFRDIVNLIESHSALRGRLAEGPSNGIISANGKEMIAFKPSPACPDGQRLKFKARTHGGGRGLTGDKVILDEAFALQASHMGSLLPTLSAVDDPQVGYGSSACHANSHVLRTLVERGRSEDPLPRRRLGYLEYCAPEKVCESEECVHLPRTPGCAMDVREYIQMANPQAGRRISWDYLEAEREALPPAEFGRERMGWHDKPDVAEGPLISVEAWEELLDPESTPKDPVSFGIYVNRMQTAAAIGVAAFRADGLVHVGVVPVVDGEAASMKPGMSWIPARAKQLKERWNPCAFVIDERSEAAPLIEDLAAEEIGIEATTTKAVDMATACNDFYRRFIDKTLRHAGSAGLLASVTSGKKRDLGDAWAWDRKDPTSDITQLVAVTLALHGLIKHERPEVVEVWEPFWT